MKLITVLALGLLSIAFGSRAIAAQDAAPPTIDGKWHFVLDTPGGDREVDSEFAVDKDGNVTGKWGNATVAGTFTDGKLNQGDLTGNWEFSSYSGTFKASRPKTA